MEVLAPTVKSPTQTVVEELRRQAGLATETSRDGTINFSGLTPLEIRGLCAMTIGAVERRTMDYEWAAIRAWFSAAVEPDKKREWTTKRCAVEAWKRKIHSISALHAYIAPRLTIQSLPACKDMMMMVHAKGDERERYSERRISTTYDIPKTTLHRNIVTISTISADLRRNGMRRISGLFEAHGLTEPVEEACIA
jgi:hypothetical protein